MWRNTLQHGVPDLQGVEMEERFIPAHRAASIQQLDKD
jgi:hypothetical protein